jgi:cell wall assembly regulator SMI1
VSDAAVASVQDTWSRFEHWLRANWPKGLARLKSPATDDQVAALEAALGVRLPADYVASLKCHDGQVAGSQWLFPHGELLSTSEVLGQWTVWRELLDDGEFEDGGSDPQAGIRGDWWNPQWIPFTHNGGGDHLCLDLDPAAGGCVGQVITMWHDMAEREREGDGFAPWFARYVDDVLAGKVVYSEKSGGMVAIDPA